MLTTEKLVTAEELLTMPKGKHYDLLHGGMIKISPVRLPHGRLAARLSKFLGQFIEQHPIGEIFLKLGFQLARNPDTVLGPDVAYVSRARIEQVDIDEGFFPGAPDLPVEVISPSETDQDVQAKVAAYLHAGAILVWVVRPKRRTVTVHYPDGTARTLTETMTLSGEDVLPGFSLALSELFA
ncbi:MAG: Uma2 family endonuclease [Anaerolineales bacterium]